MHFGKGVLMNPTGAAVQQHPKDLRLLDPRRELMVRLSRRLLLAVALTSTMGWIYFLSKAAMFVGAAMIF
jgi:hypothetical protein